MNLAELNKVANAMVAPGKGILAADESTGTIKKRFDAIGVENTEDNRRDYRELLFRSAEAMRSHISGVILYDETIWQKAKDGTPLVKLIEEAGAIPGIKVDEGTKPLPGCPNEVVTVGLDKLADRLPKYYAQGARFAKWRAVIDIGAGIPTHACVHANAHALARYAALCQAAQIVPIVEPEVLMDGDHDIDRCYEVTEWVLKETFQELYYNRVALEGMVLKPNMAVPGKKSAKRAGVEEVAEKTVRLLKTCVPGAVPGIAFLSGGQSDEEATAHLDAMNRIGDLPWKLTFSYGRALQARSAEGLVRQVRKRRRRAARLLPPRPDERPRQPRPVEGGSGEEGGVGRAIALTSSSLGLPDFFADGRSPTDFAAAVRFGDFAHQLHQFVAAPFPLRRDHVDAFDRLIGCPVGTCDRSRALRFEIPAHDGPYHLAGGRLESFAAYEE